MAEDKIAEAYLSFRFGLRKLVGRIVKDSVEVEDILQEAYIRTFEASQKKTIRSPKAFLARTASNLALNHIALSAVKFNRSLEESDVPPVYSNDPGILDQVESQQRFKHFCRAVRNLPVRCRRVFILKQVYGMSQKEIARTMGISEKTVEKNVAKGLFRCREYLSLLEARPKARRVVTNIDAAGQDRKTSGGKA